jgi:hypothetical protein
MSRPAVAPAKIRFAINPGDVPAVKAARRLHLTLEEFQAQLPELIRRGFPPADPTTNMFCLEAIDAWRFGRYPQLLGLTGNHVARDAREVAGDRIKRM